jgi:hypothetical protein
MPEQSLLERGIKRKTPDGIPDLETCKQYAPFAVCSLGVVASKFGLDGVGSLFLPDKHPDWLTSAYRDKIAKNGAKNSPHFWGCAFDVSVGSVLKQIQFVSLAIDSGLFNRGGIYKKISACHIDQCSNDWMKEFNGSKFWVMDGEKYHGFETLSQAAAFALK